MSDDWIMTLAENLRLSDNPDTERVRITSATDFAEVEEIPQYPESGEAFRIRGTNGHPSYTHYLFRFPAKFHPPVVSWALETYGNRHTAVLDPFAGSGTVQVEALVRGMPSVALDIDPLACFIARAKTSLLPPENLIVAFDKIESLLGPFRRSDAELEDLRGADISDECLEKETQDLDIPTIPNALHWFRRHVLVDLARVFWAIREAALDAPETHFFHACAAAITRRVSNADPDPVSGLEVTQIQAKRNARRVIRVFDVFAAKALKAIQGMSSLWEACDNGQSTATTKVLRGDALNARALFANEGLGRRFPLVITSPPYCTAVNYSRRHKLEMYWLGLVEDAEHHLRLTHSYIGRRRVRLADWDECDDIGIKDLDQTLARIAERDHTKARALKHYFWSMAQVFAELRQVLARHGTLVCAIGDSVCRGIPVTTAQFIMELASPHFTLERHFSYAVRNHYMQYPLRNGGGIRREYLLVFGSR